jgi:hypothetical protein
MTANIEVEVIRTKSGFKGDSAIAELTVRESAPLPGGEAPSRVGETVDYVENLTDQKKGGGGRFKAFLMSLVGADEYEFANPAALAKFTDERQAGTELLIRIRPVNAVAEPLEERPDAVLGDVREPGVCGLTREAPAVALRRSRRRAGASTRAAAARRCAFGGASARAAACPRGTPRG